MAENTSATRTVNTNPSSVTDTALDGFEHRYATVNGVRLHYVISGPSAGDTVVLFASFP